MSGGTLQDRLCALFAAAAPHMGAGALAQCEEFAGDSEGITRRVAHLCDALGYLVRNDSEADPVFDKGGTADLLLLLGDIAGLAAGLAQIACMAKLLKEHHPGGRYSKTGPAEQMQPA